MALHENGSVTPCDQLTRDEVDLIKWVAGVPTEKTFKGEIEDTHKYEGAIYYYADGHSEDGVLPAVPAGDMMNLPLGEETEGTYKAHLQFIYRRQSGGDSLPSTRVIFQNGRSSIPLTGGLALNEGESITFFAPNGGESCSVLRVSSGSFSIEQKPLHELPDRVRVVFDSAKLEVVGRR